MSTTRKRATLNRPRWWLRREVVRRKAAVRRARHRLAALEAQNRASWFPGPVWQFYGDYV